MAAQIAPSTIADVLLRYVNATHSSCRKNKQAFPAFHNIKPFSGKRRFDSRSAKHTLIHLPARQPELL